MTKENTYLIFFTAFVLIASIAIINGGYLKNSSSCEDYETQQILIGEKNINVEISNDDCKRTLGLSGRRELKQDTGMLFLFTDEASHGIWMKNMNFPIDIIWINSNEEIVLINDNVLPETYPDIFGNEVLSKFVLELPAGFVAENNIKAGDKVLILKQ